MQMTISTGDKLPEVTVIRVTENGPEEVALADLTAGRKVVIFAVPGAFTATCHSAHMPSFIRTRDQFAEKGVDEIFCLAVNDPFVLEAWAKDTGADKAGITMISDASCALTEALGMRFDFAPKGLIARSKRYALVAEDGVVTQLNVEKSPGTCELSAGEALLEAI